MTEGAPAVGVSGAPSCASGERRWIPAFAGMTEEGLRGDAVRTFIPASAGMTEEGLRAYAVRTIIPEKPVLAKTEIGYSEEP